MNGDPRTGGPGNLPAPGGGPIIRLEGIEKSMEGKKVLDRVDLDVAPRRITALIGLSGSGKSVLLKHMIGLVKPDRGRVLVDGMDLALLSRRDLYGIRGRFGMLFQGGALFDSLTVFENVAFPLREKTALGEEEIRERVRERLAQVGLEGQGEKYPDELSGGMVRRVALARAMATDPEIILFDEPTTGLDPIIRTAILGLIGRMHERHGFTMVMVSHDIPEIFEWCHDVAVVRDGRIVESGPKDRVVGSADPFVRQLIRGDVAGPVHPM